MKSCHFIVIILVFLSLLAFAQDKQQQTQSEYASLVARAKAGDKDLDFKKLRTSFMDSPEYHQAKDTDKEEKDMIADINNKDFQKALKDADVVLANDYVNIDAHFVSYIANRELHNDEKAAFYRFMVDGLLKSILQPGCKTIETACDVINTHEEYVVLRFLGLMPSKQSLSAQGGHQYDVLETKNPETGDTVTLYFNVDIPMKHYLN